MDGGLAFAVRRTYAGNPDRGEVLASATTSPSGPLPGQMTKSPQRPYVLFVSHNMRPSKSCARVRWLLKKGRIDIAGRTTEV